MRYLSNEIRNGRIIKTFLGKSDYNNLTCYLTVKGDGWGCDYGGFTFSGRDGYVTLEVLEKVLDTIGVKTWEQVNGQFIRVQFTEDGTMISKIGNLIEDKWFSFKEFFGE